MIATEEQLIEQQLLPAVRDSRRISLIGTGARNFDQWLRAISQSDQFEAFTAEDLPRFERWSSVISFVPLDSNRRESVCLEVWRFGLPVIRWISMWNWGRNLPAVGDQVVAKLRSHYELLDAVKPRYVAAMTTLARTWLKPVRGESRGEVRERIPSLRPVEESDRLRELMGKNTEGTLTADERGEFERLHEFFETLQDIIDAALYPPTAQS